MNTYPINLGCQCPGALGWTVEIHADTPEAACIEAVEHATTCCRCGEVAAEHRDTGAWAYRED